VAKVRSVSVTGTLAPAAASVTDGETERSLGGHAPDGVGSTVGVGARLALADALPVAVAEALTDALGDALGDVVAGVAAAEVEVVAAVGEACGSLPPPSMCNAAQKTSRATVSTTSLRRQ
jgi:hypothetical protein